MNIRDLPVNIDEDMFRHGKGHVYDKVISDTERDLIEKALTRSFGNQSIASKILGINRNTLRSKIKKLQINVKRFKI